MAEPRMIDITSLSHDQLDRVHDQLDRMLLLATAMVQELDDGPESDKFVTNLARALGRLAGDLRFHLECGAKRWREDDRAGQARHLTAARQSWEWFTRVLAEQSTPLNELEPEPRARMTCRECGLYDPGMGHPGLQGMCPSCTRLRAVNSVRRSPEPEE